MSKITKSYTNINVYDAFQERIKYIFDNFDNIYIAFSGGKDSGLLLNLVLKYMQEHNIRQKIGLFHQDFEAQYTETSNYVERTFVNTPDFIDKYWCCIPEAARNCFSVDKPFWYPWDDTKKELWVRPMPNYPYVYNLDNHKFDFYKYKMSEKEFHNKFVFWYKKQCGGGKTIGLLGLRADESLNRYSAIINKRHMYKDNKWITAASKDCYNACPIYDWAIEDVWTANGKFNFDYNKLYDLYYRAGIPFSKMRVASPFCDQGRESLSYYRVIEPAMWAKLVDRVNGANFGGVCRQSNAFGYNNINLPKGYTWKSYAKYLFATLPEDAQKNYERIFDTSTRLDNLSTWKKMCICILRNDHTCMGFSPTTNEQRINQIKNKYKSIIRGRA